MAKVKTGGLGRGLSSLFEDIDFHPEAVSVKQPEALENGEKKGGEVFSDNGRIVYVSLDQIKPNAGQPRTQFGDEPLQELTDSIQEHGVIQPILLRPTTNGYEIVAGERRYRAARRAGLKVIPAIVRELDERQNMLYALIENMQRENLNSIDEARGLSKMLETFGLTQEEVAKSVGKSRPYVTNALRLLKLPESVQMLVEAGRLSAGHARTIAGIDGSKRQIEAADKTVKNGWSVRELERFAERTPHKKKRKRVKDTQVKQMEETLSGALGTRVRLSGTAEKGKIQLEYYSREELDRLLDLLSGLS
ncbi:MAG: ParB/RepB/Spo0J family partition protein [Bacillota bacterium]|jgi:ParB family chromosome partitioning protein|nr:ParB/RepB/Spo0J family partition protein [Eubacteriales bacterium]MDI9492237.1 ParB/RepB/Spo0J family partition protein [Bacillota bacterium]NLV70774.1 ParB/RepB/Spo0J family partition protein [Clostridiales bacterium]HRV33483.1 ParB/RepB/Spo0J family partition protein [Anaerovoracaceae bacterium]MDD3536931.1 ParB/RepB/Spo0J family partition protein [Eubacteriales bacterium]